MGLTLGPGGGGGVRRNDSVIKSVLTTQTPLLLHLKGDMLYSIVTLCLTHTQHDVLNNHIHVHV